MVQQYFPKLDDLVVVVLFKKLKDMITFKTLFFGSHFYQKWQIRKGQFISEWKDQIILAIEVV